VKTKKPRNKFELEVFTKLKRKKVKFKYESEKILYVYSGHYIPDFVIDTKQGKIYVETKGYLRATDKRKMAAVKKCNPTLDIRFVFHPKCKKADLRWAEKNGFPFAIEAIPKEWLQ